MKNVLTIVLLYFWEYMVEYGDGLKRSGGEKAREKQQTGGNVPYLRDCNIGNIKSCVRETPKIKRFRWVYEETEKHGVKYPKIWM